MDGGRKEESKSLPVLAADRNSDTVSHPEGRKRTCGNDSGVKEMIPFVVGWEANKRWIGHLRVPIRHYENESKSTVRGFGPFVPLPLACRQKSSNRETFLNKRGEGEGDAFILPVARPESEGNVVVFVVVTVAIWRPSPFPAPYSRDSNFREEQAPIFGSLWYFIHFHMSRCHDYRPSITI